MSDPHAAPLEDEPRTPMWLPALGAALFIGAGLWWAVTPSSQPISAEPADSASAAAAPSAPPAVAAAVPAPVAPTMSGSAALRPLGRPAGGPTAPGSANPGMDERLRRIHDRMNAAQGAGGHR